MMAESIARDRGTERLDKDECDLFSIVCLHLEEHIGVEFRTERSKNGTFARMQICFILDSGEVFSFT